MNDDQLLRYSRQIMLPQIDLAGQQKLTQACIMIVGLGGLGSAASIYLAAAGTGQLILVDFDRVELSNLQRQIVHTTNNIGQYKVDSAKHHLMQINPDTNITTIKKEFVADSLEKQIQSAAVVLDCSDNFKTRFAINDACLKYQKPLVSAAAIRFEAQISVFNSNHENSPCYRCLYNDETTTQQTCEANGVIAPLLGIIGSIQACEAMKIIMCIGKTLVGRLLIFDAIQMEWHQARLNQDTQCPACNPKIKA